VSHLVKRHLRTLMRDQARWSVITALLVSVLALAMAVYLFLQSVWATSMTMSSASWDIIVQVYTF